MTEQAPSRPSALVIQALERQLEVAQRITHIGSWEWNASTNEVTWSAELYRIYDIDPGTPLSFETFLSRIHPEDRERVQRQISDAMQRGGRFSHLDRVVWRDGTVRELDTAGEVMLDAAGKPVGLIGTSRDVTEERTRARAVQRSRQLQGCERTALEQLAAGKPLLDVLSVIVRGIEEVEPRMIASLLLIGPSGKRFWQCIAPSLPRSYNLALEGAEIGPVAGSCGTAAYRREQVFVANVSTDPLWVDYKHLVEPLGLRACWSSPIIATDGRVLGTFAVYYREARLPDADERELIARATHVAGIAIERRELDDQLRALSARIEAVRERDRTAIAREIHDELGQALTALKMDIAWVQRRLPNVERPITDKLVEITRAADEIIGSIRRISAELRPGILDDLGLVAAIEWQADEFSQRSGIPCDLTCSIGEIQLERELATGVFRVFQESLTNVVRHANATRIHVRLYLRHGNIVLEVGDDGIGVPELTPQSSLGLLGMRERARRLDGTCEVRPGESGKGTLVVLKVPLRFPRRDLPHVGQTPTPQ
jgi:signal transduction histidine kinase